MKFCEKLTGQKNRWPHFTARVMITAMMIISGSCTADVDGQSYEHQNEPSLEPKWWQRIENTPYGMRFDVSKNKYIGNCIRNRGVVVTLMLNQMHVRAPIIDLHIIAYIQDGRPCLGFYVTSWLGPYCRKICGNEYHPGNQSYDNRKTQNDIEKGIGDALIAVGLAIETALVIAKAAAPLIWETLQNAGAFL